MSDDFHKRILKGLHPFIAESVARNELGLTRYCESPIEMELGVALCCLADIQGGGNGAPWFNGGIEIIPQALVGIHAPDRQHMLIPQYEVAGYRLDFMLMFYVEGRHYWRAGIECDGHAFHEKTKEQAARDKARDRALAAEGIAMFRFTGSEIYRGSVQCAAEILEAAANAYFLHKQRKADVEEGQ